MKGRRQRVTIFFVFSETMLSKAIRFVTRCRFSHCTVADADAVMDITIADGTKYIPLIPYCHLAAARGWRCYSVGRLRPDLPRYEGRSAPSKWRILVKVLSLGWVGYAEDCVGTTIEVLEGAGMPAFPRNITTPKKLIHELEKRGYCERTPKGVAKLRQ